MFLDDLVTLYEAANVGVAGQTIFWSSGAQLPSTETPILHLRETGGTAPFLMHNSVTTPAYVRPSAQVVSIADDYDGARSLIQAAWDASVQKRNFTVNGVWYISLDVNQNPFDLGPDESGLKIRCAFNVDAVKRPF